MSGRNASTLYSLKFARLQSSITYSEESASDRARAEGETGVTGCQAGNTDTACRKRKSLSKKENRPKRRMHLTAVFRTATDPSSLRGSIPREVGPIQFVRPPGKGVCSASG